jgi:hypothetical protein
MENDQDGNGNGVDMVGGGLGAFSFLSFPWSLEILAVGGLWAANSRNTPYYKSLWRLAERATVAERKGVRSVQTGRQHTILMAAVASPCLTYERKLRMPQSLLAGNS